MYTIDVYLYVDMYKYSQIVVRAAGSETPLAKFGGGS